MTHITYLNVSGIYLGRVSGTDIPIPRIGEKVVMDGLKTIVKDVAYVINSGQGESTVTIYVAKA